MLSTKCKYAIRALIYLSLNSSIFRKINIIHIGEALDIPVPYLRKILQDLVPKNIVSSTKGPNGGFYMTEENKNTSLMRVVEVIDGLRFFDTCGLGLRQCTESNPCPFHDDYKEIKDRFKGMLIDKSLADLAADIKTSKTILVN